MVFGLIFIVISSPFPLPSDVDEQGNNKSVQSVEESIQGGNIEEPFIVETMRDVSTIADEFLLDKEQIYPEIQLDAAYNYQRDQLTFIKL